MNLNTCRLCGDWKETRHTGPVYKYSVRHYAHARCGIVRWGREWLDKQPDHVIIRFPWFLAEDLMIGDYIKARYEAWKAKNARA